MIGIYDTGLGGKYIADGVTQLLPDVPVAFYADKEALPLGNKPSAEIRAYVIRAVQELFEQGCQLVILACNTASVHTIRYLQQEWLPNHYPERKILGVTVPLRECLDTLSDTQKTETGILIATQATIDSGFYQQDFAEQGLANLTAVATPKLASAIEANDQASIQTQIQELKDEYPTPSYLILACTHYTHVAVQLRGTFPNTTIIDPSDYIIERIVEYWRRTFCK